eukprot:5438065-Alexandrium_andersonii.AAC.1
MHAHQKRAWSGGATTNAKRTTNCANAARRRLQRMHWQACATQEWSTMDSAAFGAANTARPNRPHTRTQQWRAEMRVLAASCAPQPGARGAP